MVVGGGRLCKISWFAGYMGLLEERDKEEGRKEMWERRGINELFILFDWVVYIILMSCMLK